MAFILALLVKTGLSLASATGMSMGITKILTYEGKEKKETTSATAQLRERISAKGDRE